MRRLLLAALVLAGALGSCSSTLRLTATAPAFDNDGLCSSPVLLAVGPLAPRMMHFRWNGPVVGEDSLAATAGNAVVFTRTVPPGLYTIVAWASDSGGAGCDTTITRRLKAAPWRVGIQ